MQQPVNIHRGNLSETYAQLILSSFAIATPVPRQNDFQGIDFHCALLREVSGNLQPFAPFNLQVKSSSEKSISYGGNTDSGKWKRHEIELLRDYQTPFFIGSVNKQEQSLEIYQTITRVFLWGEHPPYEVKLLLGVPEFHGTLTKGERKPIGDLKESEEYDPVCWEIPLGVPILTIRLSEIEDKTVIERAVNVLHSYIKIDQENIVLLNAGLAHFKWPSSITRNAPANDITIMQVAPDPPTALLEALTPAIACLLKLYESKGEFDLILPWEDAAEQLPNSGGEFFKGVGWMKKQLDETIERAKSAPVSLPPKATSPTEEE